MPFVKKSEKKKSVPAQPDIQRFFIGREQELHFICEHLLDPEVPDYNVVSFYGQGGIGKSTLLSRLENDIRTTSKYKDSCLMARVNERKLTPTSVMEAFADQLDLKGEFEKALGHYKEALRKLYDEREQEQETFGRKATMAFAGSVAKSVPVPGVSDLLSQGAEQASGWVWDEMSSRQRLKNIRRLENPLQDLTDGFITELNKLAERQGSRNRPTRRILLCFDTFEQLTTEIAPWLLDYFLEKEINENIVLIVAGRHKLSRYDSKRWLKYLDGNTLHEMELKTFSKEETASYLAQRGITEATRVNQIWQLSHGLPLYLGMLTANQDGKIDPTTDVVQNFLRWIPPTEEVKQRLVLDAALFSRAFNRDDLKAFAYVGEEQRTELYNWLLLQPFIHDVEGRHNYHDIAQEMFSRYLYTSSPEDCREIRKSLAAHYQKALAAIEVNEGDEVEEWLELALALIQQLLLLSDEEKLLQAVGLVVRAIGVEWEASRSEKVSNVLQRLQDGLGQQMTERARRMVKRLLSYQNQMIEKPEWYEAVHEFTQKMLPSPQKSLEALVILYFMRAKAYREQEEDEKALDDFQHVLELNPQYPRAWYGQGATLGKLKRHKEALAAYEEAIKLKPHYVAAWNNKGDMLDILERYEEALAAYDEAIKLNPQYPRAWYNKGITLWKRERYEEALAAYSEAIKLNPHYADAWYNKGIVLSRLKRQEEALAAFEEALIAVTFNPTIPAGWNNKGDMLIALKRQEEALAAYDEAIKLNPHYADAWYNKGITFWNLGRNEEALVCFENVLAVNPQNAVVWMDKGNLFYDLERYEEAIGCYDKVVTLNPQNREAWNNKGVALTWLERNEEALVYLDRALAIDPDYSTACSSKAYVLNELKRYEEALLCCDKALAIDPQSQGPWRHKGKALRRLHRNEEALVCFDKSLAIDAQHTESWYNKGAVLWQLERNEEAWAAYDKAVNLDETIELNPLYVAYYAEALVAYEEAIKLNSQYMDAWDNKGIILYKLRKGEESRATYEEAIKQNPHYTELFEKELVTRDEATKQYSQSYHAWYRKGIALWRLARDEEAQAAFDEAIKLKSQNKSVSGSSTPGLGKYVSPDLVDDEYLNTEIVILLQATNLYGEPVYSYLQLLGSSLKKMFAKMQAGENFKPADFGTVVAAGRGIPSQETRDEMKREYNMIDVPTSEAEPAIQPKSFDDENTEG